MNIFDTPAIKNSWENRGPNYRAEVQATLNDIYNASEGNFDAVSELNKNAEWLTGMKADTLENTDAELIMSNLYKDTFGVPDGKSLTKFLMKEKISSEGKLKICKLLKIIFMIMLS